MSSPRLSVFNMTLPAEGPVNVPYNVDMGAQLDVEIDLTQYVERKIISFISGMWCDNSANAQNLTLSCSGTKMAPIFPASKQGWLPLQISNPPVINISQTAFGGEVKFLFVNYPVFPYIF